MQTACDPRFWEPGSSASGRSSPAEDDYRVKIFKAAARSARDEVERANAALAERRAAEQRCSRARREAEVRSRDGSGGPAF
jgi:hypothetical protein